MSPAVNPNPDRARRGANVVSKDEAKDEFVPEPLLPVGAPAAAARAPIRRSTSTRAANSARLKSWLSAFYSRSRVVEARFFLFYRYN